MAELIILRGNSGSGKSTLARRLQQTFGRNADTIIRQHRFRKASSIQTIILFCGRTFRRGVSLRLLLCSAL